MFCLLVQRTALDAGRVAGNGVAGTGSVSSSARTCPIELDVARRLAQTAATNARLKTHMRPVHGEPRRMKTSQMTDIETANAATPVQLFDTKPSLEVALPLAKIALVRRLPRMELASTALRKAEYLDIILRALPR
jgi:hypothetical protein